MFLKWSHDSLSEIIKRKVTIQLEILCFNIQKEIII